MENPEIKRGSEKIGSPKDCLEKLKQFRHDWRDEIPDTTKHTTDIGYGEVGWKIQTAWYQGIQCQIDLLRDVYGIYWSEEAQKRTEEFTSLWQKRKQGNNIAECIAKGNEFLDYLIKYLEGLIC